MILWIDKQVLWFDVPVDDAVRMQIPHAVNQLVKDVARHLFAKPICVLYEAIEFTVLR